MAGFTNKYAYTQTNTKDGEGKGITHIHDLERLRNSRGVGQ